MLNVHERAFILHLQPLAFEAVVIVNRIKIELITP